MKIYYLGRRLDGRFDSLRSFVRRVVRFSVRWSIVCGVLYGVWLVGSSQAVVTATVVDSFPQKVDALKDDVVTRLAADCESKGYTENDGIIIFDTNNKASIGRWQWQKASVIHYYKTLYGKHITPKEAVLIALDDERAAQLTKDVLFNVEGGYKNWLNCANKLGLAGEIRLIKKLEQ